MVVLEVTIRGVQLAIIVEMYIYLVLHRVQQELPLGVTKIYLAGAIMMHSWLNFNKVKSMVMFGWT